ncbi:uncharacterized protein PODANS_3_1170 [Podospora anserina S mat+]|uniref:Podospora anserina S mat+ genomic DNA chromosome 3, supercontig 1 n=1 Tax=Podospora anserina (strain S / ATCC MYA-4624 / DSM 980 / FGSC 10383) TaxID=515849 RepID=B2ACJ1_PODAN|nr:uncharacterized protein PODANS_3_1170 [Podospora anserina S mat+]CAP61156.1 unnamed protein product [Podospora anserina S mat+]CDP26604.1 Putative protein of unknown function [Podospora anserina S mat+]
MAFHPYRRESRTGWGRGNQAGQAGRGQGNTGRGGGHNSMYLIGGDPPTKARQYYKFVRQNRGQLVEDESPTQPNPSDSSADEINAHDPDPFHWFIAPPGYVAAVQNEDLIPDEDDLMMDAPAEGPGRDNYYYDPEDRNTTPPPPYDRTVTGGETNMWTDIKNWIMNVAGTPAAHTEIPAPYAVCGACQLVEIDIKGIPKSHNPNYSVGLGTVLICGHILCARCYNAWCRDKYNATHGFNCPMCRAKLQCDSRVCKDIFYPYIIPPARHEKPPGNGWKEFLDYVPLTLGEGGVRPTQCHICRATRLVVLGRTAKRLFNENCRKTLTDPRAQYMGVPYSDGEMALFLETTYEPTENMLKKLKTQLIQEHPGWGGPVHPTMHIVWNVNPMQDNYLVHKRKVKLAYRAMAQEDGALEDGRRIEDLGELEEGERVKPPARVTRVPVALRTSDLANL